MNTTTLAGAAGRLAGSTARIARQIDWVEVAQIVLHGLQILICVTLLAGRWARRAWDALPVLSEQLGRRYARLIVGSAPAPILLPVAVALPAPVTAPPITTSRRAEDLALLSNRELRELIGVRRKLSKRQLIELAMAV